MSMYGPPEPWWMRGPYEIPSRRSPTLEEIFDAEDQLERLKKKIKETDEKGKRKKAESPKLSFMEAFGMLTFFSIPVTLLQIYCLQWVSTKLVLLHTVQ